LAEYYPGKKKKEKTRGQSFRSDVEEFCCAIERL